MIEEVAERVWQRKEFNDEYRRMLRRNLQEYVRTDEPHDELDEAALSRLLQSAAHFAAVEEPDRKEAAYRIASSAWSLFNDEYASGLRRLLQVIFGRLGNFPAIGLLLRDANKENNQALVSKQGDGLGTALWLEVNSRAIANEVRVTPDRILTLTDFQTRLWKALDTGRSVTVTAPTSAGKSFALQFFIGSRLAAQKHFIGLYVVPTRSLIHQVSSSLRDITRELTGTESTILTIPQTPEDARIKSGIYVLTQERLQILLELAPKLVFSLVVIDEAQTMAGDSRGIILQTVIDHIREASPETQFLFSSPPAANPQVFEGLFGLPDQTPINEEESPVAQNLIFLDSDPTILDLVHIRAQVRDAREPIGSRKIGIDLLQQAQTLATISWHFGRSDQNLVYVGSQAAAEDVAGMISQHSTATPGEIRADVLREREELSSFLRQHIHRNYLLADTVLEGVAFHYGQMPSVVRQALEDYFDEGLLRFLVSTSTLLHGVNLPAKNLFLLDPTKGGEWPQPTAQPISGPEFWNLAGRAGRLGKEFEGNIFIINQTRWRSNSVDESRKQPIQPALDEQVRDKQAELLTFISDTAHGSGKQQALESAFVRLFNEHRRGSLDKMLKRIHGPDTGAADRMKAALDMCVAEISIPVDVCERHITVSVYRQQEMYDYLTKKVKTNGPANYIPPHPQQEWSIAYTGLLRLFKRIHSQFEHTASRDNSHKYYAVLALHWMRGDPLPRLITSAYDQKKKKQKREPNLSTVIREVMSDIENELRFRYVKYVGCYVDLLKAVLTDTGNKQYLESIPAIPLYLELGATSKTMVSLISLGLSRTTAGIIAAKTANPSMESAEAESWLRRFNLEAAGVPGISIREVEKLWTRK